MKRKLLKNNNSTNRTRAQFVEGGWGGERGGTEKRGGGKGRGIGEGEKAKEGREGTVTMGMRNL